MLMRLLLGLFFANLASASLLVVTMEPTGDPLSFSFYLQSEPGIFNVNDESEAAGLPPWSLAEFDVPISNFQWNVDGETFTSITVFSHLKGGLFNLGGLVLLGDQMYSGTPYSVTIVPGVYPVFGGGEIITIAQGPDIPEPPTFASPFVAALVARALSKKSRSTWNWRMSRSGQSIFSPSSAGPPAPAERHIADHRHPPQSVA